MKKIIKDTNFFINLETFVDGIVASLSSKIDFQISKISVPQSLICYRVDSIYAIVQLRLVLIPFKNGEVLGRLSWLDERGNDRACCYLNKCFDCVVMMPNNGCLKKEDESAENLCFQVFEFLMNESR